MLMTRISSFLPFSHSISRDSLPVLLSLLFMLIKAFCNLLYLSILTSFLEQAGAASLPWVYLGVNVGFILIQFHFITKIAGFEGYWLLSRLNLPMIFLSFFAAFVLPVQSVLVLVFFLIAAMLTDLISNQAFSAMLNHLLNINESKRILPYVFASGSLGYILSGLTLKFVVEFVGFKGLLLINGFFAALCYVVISLLKPFEDARLANVDEDCDKSNPTEKTEVESSLKHPLARLLVFSSFFIIFNRYLIDFLFAAAVSGYFTSGKDLASFMGIFGATADLLVIGLQAFVMKSVFARMPIGKVLAFMPAILSLLCFSAFFSLKFTLVAAVQFLVMINSKNFTVPATAMLMGAIPLKNRAFYRRDMSVACAVASTLVGIFLLLVRGRLSSEALFFCAALVYLGLSIIHYLIDRAYLKTLQSQIVRTDKNADSEQVASIRYLSLNDRMEQLGLILQSDNSNNRLMAIREVAELPSHHVARILGDCLQKESDARCVAEIARVMVAVCGESAAKTIQNIAAKTEDYRLKADLIEALGKLQATAEGVVISYLDHFHHRVKAAAVISLIRIARSRENLELALGKLAAMARDNAEMMRAAAAAVMGEVGLPLFLPCLENLAFAARGPVAVSALNAIARIQSPASLASLERIKKHSDLETAQLAKNLADSSARQNLERIGRMLTSITAEERSHLAARLRCLRNDENFELLSLVLCIEEVEVRKRLVKLLEKNEPFMIELLSRSVMPAGTGKVRLTLAPAFSLAIDECCLKLPEWSEIFFAVGCGNLENSESPYLPVVRQFLLAIWAENLVGSAMELAPEQIEILAERTITGCAVVCCLAKEPVPMLKSIERAAKGSAYASSLAFEYLEGSLSKPIAEILIPLLENATNKASGDKLKEKQEKINFEISAASLESARARLERYLANPSRQKE